ncbi:antitoxin component HigA of HigAB toxin-antitoxin module [Sporomusaceae bacterium BoRhaA]|uniref:hypothetical protein n=1 Tax=Pelorhabdus rhamnosifermentans TaxID=2772457 RepID=UPI001C063EF0|nr:hypothetical protein [Pelorhabdus rhamnosifermentans]MBU2701142.1 antitoxin component HigA of HigAB toxin-antitoxin module [Pelorhabdus rhamnosifermentans]
MNSILAGMILRKCLECKTAHDTEVSVLRAKLEAAEKENTELQQVIDSQKETNLVLVKKLEVAEYERDEANRIVKVACDDVLRLYRERDEARRQFMEFSKSPIYSGIIAENKQLKTQVEELQAQVADLKQTNSQLADAAVERPPYKHDLLEQVAVMRGALEKYNDLMCMSEMAAQYGGKLEDKLKFASRRDAIAAEMVKALDTTPAEAVERVQGLVEALKPFAEYQLIQKFCDDYTVLVNPWGKEQKKIWRSDFDRAKEALTKYRGEK